MALLGFAPSTRKGPPNTVGQLDVEISAGSINGVLYGMQFITLVNFARTQYVFVDNNGNLSSSLLIGGGVNLIATVVTGLVTTSGTQPTATGTLSPLVPGNVAPPPSTNLTQVNSIISIVDNRNWS
jgi:hypothetical protein